MDGNSCVFVFVLKIIGLILVGVGWFFDVFGLIFVGWNWFLDVFDCECEE